MKILRHLYPAEVERLVSGEWKPPRFDAFILAHGGVMGVEQALRDPRFTHKYWNVLEQSPEEWLPDPYVEWERAMIPTIQGTVYPWSQRKIWDWSRIDPSLQEELSRQWGSIAPEKRAFMDLYLESPPVWMFDPDGRQLEDMPPGFAEAWQENVFSFRSLVPDSLANATRQWTQRQPLYLEHAGLNREVTERVWREGPENVLSVPAHEPWNVGWILSLVLRSGVLPGKWIAFTNRAGARGEEERETAYKLAAMLNHQSWHAWV